MQIVPISDDVEAPFRLSSPPQRAFAHSGWVHAEQQALASIAHRRHLLLLGEPGTGKSLLLRSLGRTLGNHGANVRHLRSGDTLGDLADEDVLLVDEAVLLPAAEIEQLLQRPNPLVMAGLPSLPDQLLLRPNTFHSVTLEPLTSEEVARFVIAQLVASGRLQKTFTPGALIALAHASKGLLRLVVVLAGAALFFAEQRGVAQVTADDVADAVAMRSFPQEEVEQTVAPEEEIARPQLLGERVTRATSEVRPWWPNWVPDREQWYRIAGLTIWVCSSIAVIGIATMVARGIKPVPALAVQEIQGRSTPQMASVPVPDMALVPALQPTASIHGPMAMALPPVQAVTALSPALTPEARWSGIQDPRADYASENEAARTLAANPVDQSATVLSFTGPILNDTMKQGGQLSLQLRLRGVHGPVAAVFHASQGLIGSGVLTGDVEADGRITLSGRLMMGRNPFDCTLRATLGGKRLVGGAIFVHANTGTAAHSSFNLSRL